MIAIWHVAVPGNGLIFPFHDPGQDLFLLFGLGMFPGVVCREAPRSALRPTTGPALRAPH